MGYVWIGVSFISEGGRGGSQKPIFLKSEFKLEFP